MALSQKPKRVAMDYFLRRMGFVVVGVVLAASVAVAATLVGERAPDFALKTLNGQNLRISEYRSEIVVLSFVANWCRDCKRAAPVLASLERQFDSAGRACHGCRHRAI